jgi:hypothetical protein
LESNSTFWRLAFGAIGTTQLGVYADSVEDALEIAAGWLAEYAPGHLTPFGSDDERELFNDAKRDLCCETLGVRSDLDCEDWEQAWQSRIDGPVDHTYTESGWLRSWEWRVDECEDPIPHRLTAGVLPSREVFDALFWLQSDEQNRFPFRNDPRVGTDTLTADQLWAELQSAIADGDAWHAQPACEDPADNGDCCGECDACTDLPYAIADWCSNSSDGVEPCGDCDECNAWADRTDQWASSVLGVLGLEWL